jgi:ABC-type transporter Mla MlaB component
MIGDEFHPADRSLLRMPAKGDPRLAVPEEPPATRERGPRAPPEPSRIVFVFSGPIAPADVPMLCERVRRLLEDSDADLVFCDVGAIVEPDAGTVDVLARLQLTARRLARRVHLLDACGDLRDLLGLMGVTDVVPICEELRHESRGQAEQREPAGGIEEEGDPADPIA